MQESKSDFKNPKHAVVSLSGGMDSSTLLLKCLDKFETVTDTNSNHPPRTRQ